MKPEEAVKAYLKERCRKANAVYRRMSNDMR